MVESVYELYDVEHERINVVRHVRSVVPDHFLGGDVVGPHLTLSPLLDRELALRLAEALTCFHHQKTMHPRWRKDRQ